MKNSISSNKKQSSKSSYIMMVSAMLIFGTIGIFRRFIPLSSAILAFARGVIGALVLVCFVKLRGGKIFHNMTRRNRILLAVSGAVIGLNWVLLFEAYNYTTVAIATLCYYMEPTIIMLLAPVFFHEKMTGKKLLCVILSLTGMCFVSGVVGGGGISGTDLRGILFGLGAACLYSAVIIINKKLDPTDAYEKTIMQLVFAAVILIPYLILTEDFSSITLTPFAIIMVLIVAVIHTGVAYAMYFASMGGLKTQSIAVLSYIDPVSALILSAIFLKEQMTVLGIIGAVLIIGAALFSELSPKRIKNFKNT